MLFEDKKLKAKGKVVKKSPSICILDYGSGNVGSVFNICTKICSSVLVSNNQNDISNASHLILPGVGAFGPSLEKLKKRVPLKCLEEYVFKHKKPILGICVGMQMFATRGFEGGGRVGLDWINCSVEILDSAGERLPHMGWNQVNFLETSWFSKQFPEPEDFYFVHSYGIKHSIHAAALTNYGKQFVAAVEKDNIFGVQFHPEKSQESGKLLLSRFMEYPSYA